MRQSLQSKFNALGILFVILFLLMLPMVNQVKADAKDSAKEAKSTLLSKWTRELVKSLKAENVGDAEVEDYWANYGNEAKEKDPNCGAACDPNADPDGDGMSNKDEVKNGRNPKCNEEEKGADYCKGIDPYTPLPPDGENKTKTATYELLGVMMWRAGDSSASSNCTTQGGVPVTQSCAYRVQPLTRNFTRLLLYLNATQVQSVGWSWSSQVPSGAVVAWTGPQPSGGFDTQPRNYGPYEARIEAPPSGDYRFRPNPQQGTSGTWTLSIYGLVEA